MYSDLGYTLEVAEQYLSSEVKTPWTSAVLHTVGVGTEITTPKNRPIQNLFHMEPVSDIDLSSQIENDTISRSFPGMSQMI